MKPLNKKRRISIALRKARTSLENIIDDVERDAPECFPVIQQNLAVIGLLKAANLLMLEQHMEREAEKFPAPHAKRILSLRDELLRIVKTAQNK